MSQSDVTAAESHASYADAAQIKGMVRRLRDFYATGSTIDVGFRIEALKRLRAAIEHNEEAIEEAMRQDLGKSAYESYLSEIGLSLAEIDYQIKHVRSWARPHWVPSDLTNFHSSYRTVAEPYGCVLVMATWNYPFLLSIEPLVGAVAAGNCVVLKPSDYSPATSAMLERLIAEAFEPSHVTTVLGGHVQNDLLLKQPFDYVFYTGSRRVGSIVMEAAAQWPVPVSLELGGKSPCVVAADANLDRAAARIAFGKFLNCGQTCVAPDYLLVDDAVLEEFVPKLVEQTARMYGIDAFANPNWGHIINEKHFQRISGLIDSAKVVYGGRTKAETLQIEPTIMVGCTGDDAAMGEEIFGPVLPILSYRTVGEAEAFIKAREKPLACYLFTSDRSLERYFMHHVPYGGGCINDTVVHLATSRLPFGGIGASGIGVYHGRYSFDTFSHIKAILKKGLFVDIPLRYQPYTLQKSRLLHRLLK